jgi:hypothetical protein
MYKWIKWALIWIFIIILFATISSLLLWYYPAWFKQSSELDAGIVTGLIGIVTLVGTIGVTVAVNTQTQRMALRMNQENQQLQLKIQEMNVNAMMFQARSGIRDEILMQRLAVYTELCYLSYLSEELRVDANYLLREKASEEEVKNEINEIISGYENITKEIERIHREHYILLSANLEYVLSDLKHDLHMFIDYEKMSNTIDQDRRKSIEVGVEELHEYLTMVHNMVIEELELDKIEQDIALINKSTP